MIDYLLIGSNQKYWVFRKSSGRTPNLECITEYPNEPKIEIYREFQRRYSSDLTQGNIPPDLTLSRRFPKRGCAQILLGLFCGWRLNLEEHSRFRQAFIDFTSDVLYLCSTFNCVGSIIGGRTGPLPTLTKN